MSAQKGQGNQKTTPLMMRRPTALTDYMIQCDGERPCIRCSQDQTPCLLSKKPVSSDPKLVLREYVSRLLFDSVNCFASTFAYILISYVHSMESQQTRLIKALQKVHRDVQQCVKEEDMNEIVQIVRACGFDFEPLDPSQTTNNCRIARPAMVDRGSDGSIHSHSTSSDSNDGTTALLSTQTKVGESGCMKKRKLGQTDVRPNSHIFQCSEASGENGLENGISIPPTNGNPDSGYESIPSPLKRNKRSASPGLTDDYWNLDSYSDHVIQLNSPAGTNTPLPMPFPAQAGELNLQDAMLSADQWSSDLPSWPVDQFSTSNNPHTTDSNYSTNGGPEFDCLTQMADHSPLPFTSNLDWDSTLWWDPSLLFDMEMKNQEIGHGGLAPQAPDDTYEHADPGS